MRRSATESSVAHSLPTLDAATLARVHGGYAPELFQQMQKAVEMGLTINSTWTGRHADSSAHYEGKAFDAGGSPADMLRFYNHAAKNTNPHELIHRDRFIKDGERIGGIGGHDNHVHFSIG